MTDAQAVMAHLQQAYDLMRGQSRCYPEYYLSQILMLAHLIVGEADPIIHCEEGTQPLQAAE